ncbi:hypothetical protein [Paenibacillus cymbidii]|uniref:hypothetical protein n=1 Tax=Paenibacillus cymbidii TaxID=1639034 RepID=UPI001080D1F4|nr:hypothetical protein [Paenibacillus cymbidii]
MIRSFDSRDFKFWHYNISHGELLIRSTKSAKNTKNIDIMFFDVTYVELPRNISNLKIEEVKDDDVRYVMEKIYKPIRTENITILSSNDKRYLVVASLMKIVENDLDMFELPFNE